MSGIIKKIAIQGLEGSFHHAAAQKFFGKKIEIINCPTFRDVVYKTAYNDQVDSGVIAIENSTAGSILMNYQLMEKYPVIVIGEINLRIRQNLLANKNSSLSQIKEVHSHPMALMQCQESLAKYSWKLVEDQDTAFSAKKLQQSGSLIKACIASEFAARLYGLKILKKDIQSEKYNLTRFLVLHKANDSISISNGDKNKASISFWLEHKKGSLLKVLEIVKENSINLSKLQSVAIPGSHFKYCFHMDLEFNHINELNKVLSKMKKIVTNLKIYGVYTKAIKNY